MSLSLRRDSTNPGFESRPANSISCFWLSRLVIGARLRGSDQEINLTVYQLWLLSDGKAQEMWTFEERAEALKAAELSE